MISMNMIRRGTPLQNAVSSAATDDPEILMQAFGAVGGLFPYEVTAACLYYIAQEGPTTAGQNMAFWLSQNTRYLDLLFNASPLPIEVAAKALAALRDADGQTMAKVAKKAEQIVHPQRALHVLSLVPVRSDSSALIPWLTRLSCHSDERIKSSAVKLLCEIQPQTVQLGRQMQDENPRVRANVVEALWNWKAVEAWEVFEEATSDAHHRVVANALVGLYLRGDESSLRRMMKLCQSSDAPFRAAMAWSLGTVRDERGAPALQCLSNDRSVMVRKRALHSLLALESED